MSVPAHPPAAPGFAIDEARGIPARARGLLGRRSLAPGEGLWLRTRSVHTVGMRLRLDLVWLDANARPVRVDRDVGPGRVRTCLGARGGVVEVAAGRGVALVAALRASTGAATPRGPGCGCGSRGR